MTLLTLLVACGDGSVAPMEPADTVAPVEAAMAALAGASGGGWVRCELPSTAPKGMPQVLDGFVHRDGDAVAFLVDEPEGVALLRGPAPTYPDAGAGEAEVRAYTAKLEMARTPFAVARWRQAHGDVRGVCEVSEPVAVEVAGRVEGAEGGEVVGCHGRFRVREGRFTVDTWVGETCELRHDSDPLAEPVVLDAAAPPEVLVVTGRSEARSMEEKIAAKVVVAKAELAAVDEQLEELARARGAAGDEAVPVLALWEGQARSERARRQEAHDKIVAFQEALLKAYETYGRAPSKAPSR